MAGGESGASKIKVSQEFPRVIHHVDTIDEQQLLRRVAELHPAIRDFVIALDAKVRHEPHEKMAFSEAMRFFLRTAHDLYRWIDIGHEVARIGAKRTAVEMLANLTLETGYAMAIFWQAATERLNLIKQEEAKRHGRDERGIEPSTTPGPGEPASR